MAPRINSFRIDRSVFLRYYALVRRARRRPVFCVQIGANDGRTNDPVHRYLASGWAGLLVEPLPDVYERELRVTYEGVPNVQLENAAISSTTGTMSLYKLSFSSARWATGLSSFDRGVLEHHIENGYVAAHAALEGLELPDSIDEMIETIDVPTLTFRELLERHGVKRFDVICMDVEGHEVEILESIDFSEHAPDVVLYEHKNLSALQLRTSIERLRGKGFATYDAGDDIVALPRGQYRIGVVVAAAVAWAKGGRRRFRRFMARRR